MCASLFVHSESLWVRPRIPCNLDCPRLVHNDLSTCSIMHPHWMFGKIQNVRVFPDK